MLLRLCRTAVSILFNTIGKSTSEHVKLRPDILGYILELEWNEVKITLNKVQIKLLTLVTIPLKDKFKVRRILKRSLLLFHFILKQGIAWFPLMSDDAIEPV